VANKLMFVCDYKSYYGGNFIPSLMAIEKMLSKHGWTCLYIFPCETKERYWLRYMQDQNKHIQFVDFSQGQKSFVNTIKDISEKNEICIIHTHFIKLMIAEMISFSCKDTKVIAHIHSDFSQGKKSCISEIKMFLTYNVLSFKTRIISVSRILEEKYGNHCIWIGNALAKERIPFRERTRTDIRNQYGIADNTCLIEIFGWSPDVKGVDIAVNAVKKLVDENIDVRLAIVCGRQTTPQKMKEFINKKTDCDGNEDFLIYWEPDEDVYGYHRASDILLSASRSEGFSYSVLEMLSIGKPCVISDIPGLQWAREFSGTYYYNKDDTNELSKCLHKVILNGEINMERNSRLITEKYSIDDWAQKIVDVYDI